MAGEIDPRLIPLDIAMPVPEQSPGDNVDTASVDNSIVHAINTIIVNGPNGPEEVEPESGLPRR